MFRRGKWIALAALLVPLCGCGFLGFLQPNQTTVQLINTNSSYEVKVELYYSDDQNALEDVLTATGTKREITIQPNSSQTFSVDCDDLQAIVIEVAELRVIGDIGPQDGTDVYRDGDDFNCGDTLVFTFTGSAIPPELNTTFQVQ